MLDTTHTTIDTNDAETHPPSQPRLMATEDAPTDGALERAELVVLDVEELLEDALASVGRARVAVDEHHRLASLPAERLCNGERAFLAEAVQALHWTSRRIEDALATIRRGVRPEARAGLEAATHAALARLDASSHGREAVLPRQRNRRSATVKKS
jgi:hypothetical protein